MDTTLLDRTSVLFCNDTGDAESLDNWNLPILFAGAGFTHGSYQTFGANKYSPFCRVYPTILYRLGLKIDSFRLSTGTIRGLEMK